MTVQQWGRPGGPDGLGAYDTGTGMPSRSDGPGSEPSQGLSEAESPLTAAVATRDREVMAMVREAVATRSVRLAFQPVVQASAPEHVAFHEGLIRLLDRSGRVIPARDFIETVETTELGRQIDCLALELGLQALQANPGLRLSVNMSARSIGYPRWTSTLERAFARNPTIPERLIIEITESSAILLPDIVSAFMTDLQMRGVAFALDDFGAGYTSFRQLRDFDFDILKIAGEFADRIAASPDNRVLFEALISIARHFDMLTVAEGVERE
jgi:EAL domain-containing protein (putative c-di-GMP-specific phosphodiesterase class I)